MSRLTTDRLAVTAELAAQLDGDLSLALDLLDLAHWAPIPIRPHGDQRPDDKESERG